MMLRSLKEKTSLPAIYTFHGKKEEPYVLLKKVTETHY